MKTKFLLLFVFLNLYNCSSDDTDINNNEDPEQTQSNLSTETSNVNTYEVATINVNNTNLNDTYEASFAGETVTLTKINETTLGFLLPTLIDGTYTLDFELGTLDFEVTQTVLEQSSEEVIDSFKNRLETNFVATDTQTSSEGTIILESILSNATNEEKEAIALYFEANKEVFNEVINLPSIAAKTTDNIDLIRKVGNYNINVFQLGIGGLAVYGAAGLGTTGVGAILAGAGLGLMYDAIQDTVNNVDDMINTSVKVIDYNYFDASLKNKTTTTSSILSFNDNSSKIINTNQNKRSLDQTDSTSNVYFYNTFFNTYETFDSIISKMNTVINLANKIPFISITPLQNNTIPANGTITSDTITTNDFSNYSFSINNPQINVSSVFLETGKFEITVTADQSLDLSEPISTELIVTYKDDFNELSKSFDIELIEEEIPNPFIGTWEAVSFNGTRVGQFISNSTSSFCIGMDTQSYTISSATAIITNTTVNIEIFDQFKFTSYTFDCMVDSTNIDTPQLGLVFNDTYIYDNINTINVQGIFDGITSTYPLSVVDGNLILRENTLIVFEKQ